jgi:hypothetical protein
MYHIQLWHADHQRDGSPIFFGRNRPPKPKIPTVISTSPPGNMSIFYSSSHFQVLPAATAAMSRLVAAMEQRLQLLMEQLPLGEAGARFGHILWCKT